MTKIGTFEMLAINGYVNRINKVAKCDFINVSYKKLDGEISALFIIDSKNTAMHNMDTCMAFLDAIFIWAESKN